MAYYLGVDTGATKSHALLADENGRILGVGVGGPGNWESVGWDGTRHVLSSILNQVTASAGIEIAHINASGLGLAGYDWPEDHAPHLALLHDLGLQDPLLLVNDAFLGLVAGAQAGWGVVVSAGTSCNCYGRDAAGNVGRMTGSSFFGEYAGALELVQYALQAIARAWSQRGPQTALAAAFVDAAGARDVDDLLAGLMRDRFHVDAAFAYLVFETAATGDAVALQAIEWAGRQLGELANGVIRQLEMQEAEFEVVLSGSFFNGSPRLEQWVEETVQSLAHGARAVRLDMPPVAGGVLLAMEAAGVLRPTLRRNLLQTITDMDRF